MIEINLIPDVKRELLKARRQQATVISISIFTAIVSLGLVGLLAFYTFAVQAIAGNLADSGITEQSKKLQSVEDLSKTLTIQKQLSQLNATHDEKALSSRIFDFISTAVPTGKNAISISRLSLDTVEKTVTIEGEAANGYEALEVFKKTIAETKFSYVTDGETQEPISIASELADGERRYGEDGNGKRVLRFTLSFTYADELFAQSSKNGKIIAPNKQNATDSAVGVPKSLFTNKVSDEENQ